MKNNTCPSGRAKANIARALALVTALALSAAGCSNNKEAAASPSQEITVEPTAIASSAPKSAPEYTLGLSVGSEVTCWSPHSATTGDELTVASLLFPGFVAATEAANGGYAFEYVMATEITDVTAELKAAGEWGVTEESGEAYSIKLAPGACWENGEAITADSYIYSLQKLIESDASRAEYFTSGDMAPRNASGYAENGLAGQTKYSPNTDENGAILYPLSDWIAVDGAYTAPDGAAIYFALKSPVSALGGDTIESFHSAGYFTECYDALLAMADDAGLIPATDDAIDALFSFTGSDEWGDESRDTVAAYAYYSAGVYEETPWDEVGLVKTGDYELTYILSTPMPLFDFLMNCSSGGLWLVNEALYEKGGYCTSPATTLSYGPYRLESLEDGCFSLVRNGSFFGWSLPEYEGHYQSTAVKIYMTGSYEEAKSLFEGGELDILPLEGGDASRYSGSASLMTKEEPCVFRLVFATDADALASLEEAAEDGANKRILSYEAFREAIALSIDRERLALEATPGYAPSYGLFNGRSYYDIENDPLSRYRDTAEAKAALLSVYGSSGSAEPDCYDVGRARALFEEAYGLAVAEGNYSAGQEIILRCVCSSEAELTDYDKKEEALLNEFVGAASSGTGFEGKIKLEYVAGSDTRYDDVANGRVEMIRGAWEGAERYPFRAICCYTEPDYMGGISGINESSGFDPGTETLDITCDFNMDGSPETVNDTYANWAKSINGFNEGGYQAVATRLSVLASLEAGVLSSFRTIPLYSSAVRFLASDQIVPGATEYDSVYGFGGVKLITYSYPDETGAVQ